LAGSKAVHQRPQQGFDRFADVAEAVLADLRLQLALAIRTDDDAADAVAMGQPSMCSACSPVLPSSRW
jgi:hypothetical protein